MKNDELVKRLRGYSDEGVGAGGQLAHDLEHAADEIESAAQSGAQGVREGMMLKALQDIAGGFVKDGSALVLEGRWQAFTGHLQEIARQAITSAADSLPQEARILDPSVYDETDQHIAQQEAQQNAGDPEEPFGSWLHRQGQRKPAPSAPDRDALVKRLRDCKNRIGDMCKEGRPPKMSIPARPDYDDDLIICTAIDDAIVAIVALTAHADAGVVVPRHPTLDECFSAGKGPEQRAGEFHEGGLTDTPEERARFEAYMLGHCWDVGNYDDVKRCYDTVMVRMLYGVWRDRGSLLTAASAKELK